MSTDTLTADEERELFESLLDPGISLDAGGRHVVTLFSDDGGEEMLTEVPSLTEAMRYIARLVAEAGDEDENATIVTSEPLLPFEADALEEMLEEAMKVVTSLAESSYLGAVAERLGNLDLVIGWEAVPPNQDLAFGIYRLITRSNGKG